ncbi:uncharacterized protein MRET_3283 [Malassezia restricta]|uniref:uncharacterized protein n=1 Tax=Malassezia restricta TaxID=76775 RepID=UPI000DD1050A|nr:uncharacterized protein MRET_3283 [Malassezia restricta]AXA51289.1 uncharacterized protein MRET_3283 [Malassezia restricta]
MVTDTTLSYLSNALGSSALVLIIAYHILAVSTKRQVDSLSDASVQAQKSPATAH